MLLLAVVFVALTRGRRECMFNLACLCVCLILCQFVFGQEVMMIQHNQRFNFNWVGYFPWFCLCPYVCHSLFFTSTLKLF